MRPRVIMYNAVSLDGNLNGFDFDMGRYYRIAGHWKEDATLVGSRTILAAMEQEDVIPDTPAGVPPSGDSGLPLLVVPDTKGQIRNWNHLRSQPYWRGAAVWCSEQTPKKYLDSLGNLNVEYLVTGDDKTDLLRGLEWLYHAHNVRTVRVDSGGTLNGLLLRQGLVDEVSVLIHPTLTGDCELLAVFNDPCKYPLANVPLKLLSMKKIDEDYVWLRYEVLNERPGT